MDRRDFTASMIGAIALVCALLLVAGVAMAQPLRLSDDLSLEVERDGRSMGSASALLGGSQSEVFLIRFTSDNHSRLQPGMGMRWWLSQRRASIDVLVRRSADGRHVEPFVGMQFAFDR